MARKKTRPRVRTALDLKKPDPQVEKRRKEGLKELEKILSPRSKLLPKPKKVKTKRIVDYYERNRKVAEARKKAGSLWKKNLKEAWWRPDGSLLQRRRIDKDISQQEMVERLGMKHLNSYSRIERREGWADADLAKRISRILGVKVSTLFYRPDKKWKYKAL